MSNSLKKYSDNTLIKSINAKLLDIDIFTLLKLYQLQKKGHNNSTVHSQKCQIAPDGTVVYK